MSTGSIAGGNSQPSPQYNVQTNRGSSVGNGAEALRGGTSGNSPANAQISNAASKGDTSQPTKSGKMQTEGKHSAKSSGAKKGRKNKTSERFSVTA